MEKRESLYTVAEKVMCVATTENSMETPQKTKNKTAIQSSNYTSEYKLKETKSLNLS